MLDQWSHLANIPVLWMPLKPLELVSSPILSGPGKSGQEKNATCVSLNSGGQDTPLFSTILDFTKPFGMLYIFVKECH